MADDNALELLKRGDARFSKRQQLDTFRQEVALNFAPWHASFTTELVLGDDFAAHLIDGTPLLLARDFVSQVGSMTRPEGKQYFWHRSHLDKINDHRGAREYLDWRSGRQLRILNDRVSGFTRATKQADEFFALFGDAVLSVDMSAQQDSLRVRNWHTKDCVWAVGSENKADAITRKEMMPARVMKQRFGEKILHENVQTACEKNPDAEFEVRHEVLPAEEYDYYKPGLKRKAGQFASVWIDVSNKKILRETTQQTFRYVIPRWVTLPGWAYAISPATTIALPDARLIQQQAMAILEAAEKQVNPPVTAAHDSIRGDLSLGAGRITWFDNKFIDSKNSPVTPLELAKNFNLGVDALLRTESQLNRAFYLDVLRMPDTRRTKSTVETQFLIDEYVRAALPLFAPIQSEYIEALLYESDAIIELAGGYSDRDRPKMLEREDMKFSWDNPLSDMIERQQAQVAAEVGQLSQAMAALEAAAMQSAALKQINTVKMVRDTVMAVGGTKWLLDEDQSDEAMDAAGKQNAMQGAIAAAPNVAAIIDSGVNAAQAAATIPNPSEPGIPLLPAPI
jgi:hypothetical protein